MKRSELEIGKVYAYSRTADPKSLYEIDGFIIDSLDLQKDWRGRPTQEVKGRFTDRNGNPKDSPVTAPLRRLIGEYLPIKHDLEIRQKNREIARLNKQIASTQIEGLLTKHTELITSRIDISQFDIRNQYDGRATITLNADQLQKLIWAFQSLNNHEEYAQAREADRLRKAYEESQLEVNA